MTPEMIAQEAGAALAEILEVVASGKCPVPLPRNFSPELRFSPRARISRARKNIVTLGLQGPWRTPNAEGIYTLQEYASIASDPSIGTFASDDPKQVVRCLICHETAHCLLWAYGRQRQRLPWLLDRKSHGVGWRRIYASLRHELLEKD